MPALAHSKLLRTDPVAGSLLDASPSQIQLYLSEAVSLDFTRIKVYDRTRKEQATGTAILVGADQSAVSIPLNSMLTPGSYTVVWRVLSKVDGHLTAGSFAFRVRGAANAQGTPNAGTPEPVETVIPGDDATGGIVDTPFEGSSRDPSLLRWVVRALFFACAALLLGGAAVAILVVEPTTSENERDAATEGILQIIGRRFAHVASVVAFVLVVTLIMDLLLQVADIADTGILSALGRSDVANLVLNSTGYGLSWGVKMLAAVSLAILMPCAWMWVERRPGSGFLAQVWPITIAFSSLLVLGQSLGSHAAAGAGPSLVSLPVVSDWLHLVSVGFWVGGLGYMVLALFPAFRTAGMSIPQRRAFLGQSIPRFSRLAVASVVTLAVTGTYNLVLHTTDLGAILGSEYGLVLAVKVGVFIILVGLGAINLRRLTPLLVAPQTAVQSNQPQGAALNTRDSESGSPSQRMYRNIRNEALLAIVALVCAGGLTLLPPPGNASSATIASITSIATPESSATAVAHVPSPAASATPVVAESEVDVAGYNLALTTRPSLEGDELSLSISRVNTASSPLTDVMKVLFKITPQDIDAGSSSYIGTLEGSTGADRQTWKIVEPVLTLDGGYLVTTIVQRAESPDLKAAFRLDLSEDASLKASPAQVLDIRIATDPSPPITGTGTLTLTLVDGERRPVEGAKVTVSPFMPAHAHVDPITMAVPVAGQPGVYSLRVDFDMGGSWLFVFEVQRDGFSAMKIDASLEVIGTEPTPGPSPPP